MARSKPSGRRPKPDIEIGLDDEIPLRVIESICNLPSSDDNETAELASSALSQERPSKRRKKDQQPDFPSIALAQGSIKLSRRSAEEESSDFSVIRLDVGHYLHLSLNQRLHISSHEFGPGKFAALVDLEPNDLEGPVKSILSASGNSKRRHLPGSFWITIDVEIRRSGRTAEMELMLQLHWNETPSPAYPLRPTKDCDVSRSLIAALFPSPDTVGRTEAAGSPMDFYDAAFVPPKDDKIPESIQVAELEANLFPYQKRTLQWLLYREGVQWSDTERRIVPYDFDGTTSNVETFRLVKDLRGEIFYLSDVLQAVTRDISPFRQAELAVRGGILAEEMGLGKTLEILGLILLHPRPSPLTPTAIETNADLIPSGTTLIVAPNSLKAQWLSEISRHAPDLSVKDYKGCRKLNGESDAHDVAEELAAHDVIITTYSVLSAELHFATTPPERSRRHERIYPRTQSPLVKVSWWRVCLDEAQMIENGFSQAATVARVIPRINAWGITGTPVKDDVKDLFGLLLFLRYEPYCSTPAAWQALTKNHKRIFQQLFNSIALRHTKSLVRDELQLPLQKRFVISMPFTAVEEQHYQSLYKEMADECGLTVDGAPAVENWEPEDYEEKMRLWLNRLRQTALHPEIASYNRRILGHSKARPMRTVDEVLDAMLEQSENTIRIDERAYLASKLARGQLYENSPRVREALDLWKGVRVETDKLVSDARAELTSVLVEQGDASDKPNAAGLDDLDESDDELGDEESKGRLGEARRRLRGALEMQHKAVFFCANAHFQIRERPEMTIPGTEEFDRLKKLEDEGYEEAKVIRREILTESHRKATRLMNKMTEKAKNQAFAEIPEVESKTERGIETTRIVDDLEALCGELNDQANVIDEWREHVIQLLLEPLIDEEEAVETTGEELGESTKIQDEIMVYVQALRAAAADRQDALSGQNNELIKHETTISLKLAHDGAGPAPTKLIELLKIRREIKPGSTSMRAAVSAFRSLSNQLEKDTTRGKVEHAIAKNHLEAARVLLAEQTKSTTKLEAEIEGLKKTMNARLEYYRQLQAVSDSVSPYEGSKTEAAVQQLLRTEEDLRKKLSSAEAKHRYLVNLKESGSKSSEPRMCVICQTPFTTGVLTVCGHQFCKECMMLWFKAHHNCPVCKKKLKSTNLHDITINPQQLQVHSDTLDGQGDTENARRRLSDTSRRTGIYSEFNSDKLAEIQNVPLDGPSFTTKVDTLVKHILWLREADPGAKSIVFSQYKGFLNILRNAFFRFRIGFSSIDDPSGITRFKDDPSVECFLLHARAHSSGLNLVNASHVFLCEPLLNTALELQAIARVDRIGQQHETTVWLYLVSGTVEESIYHLSVQRRMEHMGRNVKAKSKESTPELLDASIEAANTLELEQAALSKLMSRDKEAGEMVAQGDLWECLFGHVSRSKQAPKRDTRFQEQAVQGYLAAEAAERRRDEQTKA